MGLVEHSKYELDLLLKDCKDEEDKKLQQAINKSILDVVKVFAKQGHSGFSARYSINILSKLLNYTFLKPLTGEDDEWEENSIGEGLFLNKRESRIFKDTNENKAYFLDGKYFSDDGGLTYYTNRDSWVEVTFPLKELPKTEYVILEEDEQI